jgi:CRP/FNR family transcriptional regulator, cyclic AMP receptor protein
VPSSDIDRVSLLLGTKLFGEVEPSELEPLARAGTIKRAVRGEHIVDPGDAADAIYVVASGQLKDAIYSADGAEVVHSLWEPGMILGEVGFLARQRTRVMSLIALEPSVLLVLRREPVMAFLTSHPAVALKLLEHLATTSRWQTEMIASLARRPLADRLLLRLLDLAESNGSIDQGSATAPRVSQSTLAAMVGASRENVNRALAALTASGTVRSEGGRYVVADPDGVRRAIIAGWPLLPAPDGRG